MIDRVRRELAGLNVADVALMLLTLTPYALGWLVGVVVRVTLWLLAAIVAGYKAGKGDNELT